MYRLWKWQKPYSVCECLISRPLNTKQSIKVPLILNCTSNRREKKRLSFKYYRIWFSTGQIIYSYSLPRLKLVQKFLKANNNIFLSVTMPFVSADNDHANEQTTWLLSLRFNTRNLNMELICIFPLLHPLWNHWLSVQSDWLSAMWFIPKSHHFLL